MIRHSRKLKSKKLFEMKSPRGEKVYVFAKDKREAKKYLFGALWSTRDIAKGTGSLLTTKKRINLSVSRTTFTDVTKDSGRILSLK